MNVAQEREFLSPFLETAGAGGILVVAQIKTALDKQLGRGGSPNTCIEVLGRRSKSG